MMLRQFAGCGGHSANRITVIRSMRIVDKCQNRGIQCQYGAGWGVMKNKNEIGARIAEIRKARRLAQADFADLIGVTRVTASNYEHGRRQVNAPRLTDIANVLECTEADLLVAPGSAIPHRVPGLLSWENYHRLMQRLRSHPRAVIGLAARRQKAS